MYALVNATIQSPDAPVEGHALVVEGDRIRALLPLADLPAAVRRIDLGGGILAAGFIDLQVNGGGGILLNDDPSPTALARIAAAHRRYGTTGLLPTVISDHLPVRAAAVAALETVRRDGHRGVLGLHLEGPHLFPGCRGVHPADRLAAPAEADFDLAARAARVGRLLVTVAPEAARPEDIRRFRAAGAVVALGHSDTGYAGAVSAFDAGATGVTHLFNAMSQLGSREPGLVGAALDRADIWCGLIADGHHVHWASVRLAWRAKGNRLVLVTDAMPPVGADGPDGYSIGGERITVADGRCVTSDGRLAGSALDMATAVRNMVRHASVPLREALAAASAAPAAAIGLQHELGRIAPGFRADLVHLDADLSVRRTWVAGEADPPF